MTSIENIVSQLNQILTKTGFDKTGVITLINELKSSGINKMKIYDFEYFNDSLADSLRHDKVELVKGQDFEAAAAMRDSENECRNYLLLKEDLAVTSSVFICKDETLYYCYFGDAKNDGLIKELLK